MRAVMLADGFHFAAVFDAFHAATRHAYAAAAAAMPLMLPPPR